MRERFNKFMAGRYGIDRFTNFLVISSLILMIISRLIRLAIFQFIGLGMILFGYYRVFSKKIKDRQEENEVYLYRLGKIKSKFRKSKNKIKGLKDYKYFKCDNCKQEIRVPRKKGRVKITCPKCKKEMYKRT